LLFSETELWNLGIAGERFVGEVLRLEEREGELLLEQLVEVVGVRLLARVQLSELKT
jgi:hypothetical protein